MPPNQVVCPLSPWSHEPIRELPPSVPVLSDQLGRSYNLDNDDGDPRPSLHPMPTRRARSADRNLMIRLLLVQGANMEWLGRREPAIYGTTSADELDRMVLDEAARRGVTIDIRYTNVEGEAITWIYEADRHGFDGLLFNPAGFLYAGYALRDCLRSLRMPAIEIHLTNIERRGMHSVTAEAALGMVTGFHTDSYLVAIDAMLRHLGRHPHGQPTAHGQAARSSPE